MLISVVICVLLLQLNNICLWFIQIARQFCLFEFSSTWIHGDLHICPIVDSYWSYFQFGSIANSAVWTTPVLLWFCITSDVVRRGHAEDGSVHFTHLDMANLPTKELWSSHQDQLSKFFLLDTLFHTWSFYWFVACAILFFPFKINFHLLLIGLLQLKCFIGYLMVITCCSEVKILDTGFFCQDGRKGSPK